MFKGVFCPSITIFGPDGKIDYRAQELHVERLINQGVDGILFCGSIGEFPSLKDNEKRELFAWAVDTIRGRTKVLAGTGGTCLSEVIDLTNYCLDTGMDGTVLISPYYFQPDERALYDYYARVADVGLPIILYNFPQRTQVSLSPALIARLAAEHEMIVGIKDTVDSMSHTREVLAATRGFDKDFSILSGYDEYFIPNLMYGGDGVLCGLTNVAPSLFTGIREAFRRNDMKELIALQEKLNSLMKLYTCTDPFLSAIKYAIHLLIPEASEAIRAPFMPIADREKRAVDEIIKEALCITR